MMGPRAGLFYHNGLGDAVNCLVLSNNLHLNGWRATTFHNTIGSMGNWFPHLDVRPYPRMEELSHVLQAFDWFFVVHNDTDEFVLKLIQEGKRRIPDKLKVIYLYPSKNMVNEPYYADSLIDPSLSVAENMRLFCERILHLPKITRSNGFIPPADLVSRKFPKRVAIHPTSTRVMRNWPKEKFAALAAWLQGQGYEPILIPGAKETGGWEELGFAMPTFPTLDLLARFLYESGFLIGNDSGLGHLASAIGVPTLTICRRKTLANMWAPSFNRGIVVTPSSWIPNIRGFRLRDQHWKKFITVGMIQRAFSRLAAVDREMSSAHSEKKE